MKLTDRLSQGSDPGAATAAALGVLIDEPDSRPRAQPTIDPHAELKGRVHRACIEKLGAALYTIGSTEELATRVRDAVAEELAIARTPLTRVERVRIEQELADDILGYGPLEPYLRDETITEIMVNGAQDVYIERDGKIQLANVSFIDDAHVLRIIDRIVSQVGRRIDEASPMVDARLPDGSRVNAIIPPLSLRGPTLTIRKFSRDPYTLADLAFFGALTPQAATFLAACVRGKINILISGGTGSGKTTLLNALSAFIPNDERIVTIEDAAELQLQQRHVVSLEARPPNVEGQGDPHPGARPQRAAHATRPDHRRRGSRRETLDMLQAMNTGHEGSLTTIHAKHPPRDALQRLEMLVLTAGVELPLRAIREQISSAFDVIIHLTRLVDGTRRVSRVTEVAGMEGEVVTMQDLFMTRSAEEERRGGGRLTLLGPLHSTGLLPNFLPKLSMHGVDLPPLTFVEAVS